MDPYLCFFNIVSMHLAWPVWVCIICRLETMSSDPWRSVDGCVSSLRCISSNASRWVNSSSETYLTGDPGQNLGPAWALIWLMVQAQRSRMLQFKTVKLQSSLAFIKSFNHPCSLSSSGADGLTQWGCPIFKGECQIIRTWA